MKLRNDIINKYIINSYPQVVPLARSGIISLSVEPEFFGFNQMIGCEDVFHQQVVDFNDDREVKTRLLADNMIIVKRDNGEISYRFSNGIEINKCPTGVIKYVFIDLI